MKKILFSLGLFLLGAGIGYRIAIAPLSIPKQKNDVTIKFQKETKKYIKRCISQTFPKDLSKISIYTDEMKELDYNYHQCIRQVIISKLHELAAKEDADKMVKSLDKFEDGILNFYWDLYNREDNGVLGREANDAALGFYYEAILDDIILFQNHFTNQW